MLSLLPVQKVILNHEIKALKHVFDEPYSSLYELLKNQLRVEPNFIEHLKCFINLHRLKKLVLSKFRNFFKYSVLYVERIFKISTPQDCYKYKEKKKSYKNYSYFILFFLYNIITILFTFSNQCPKKYTTKILFEICYFNNLDLSMNKKKKLFKSSFHLNINKFRNLNKLITTNINTLKEENNPNDTEENIKENMKSKTDKKTTSCHKSSGNQKKCAPDLEIKSNVGNDLKELVSANSLVKKKRGKTQSLNTVSTGKEEVDVIDGINIFSFENESDMTEFTMLQGKLKTEQPENVISSIKSATSERIIPTKTCDITKIKGWRNKLFQTDKNEKNPINSVKIKEENNNLCLISRPKEQRLSEQFKNSKEHRQLYNFLVRIEEYNEILKMKDESLESHQLCNSKKNSSTNDCYSLDFQLLSEDNVLHQMTNPTKNRKKDGIFQSSILDEYLFNHSKLNFSFDFYNSQLSYHKKKAKSVIPIAIKKQDPSHLNGIEEEYEKMDFSSIDFLKNMIGDVSDRKFMWVYGRPIIIEQENNKTIINDINQRCTIINLDNNLKKTFNSKNEENDLREIKFTKALDNGVALSSQNKYIEGNGIHQVKSEKLDISLTSTFKMGEVDVKSELLPKQKFIFPCKSKNNGHYQCAKFTKIQLGMVINIGNKRPFIKEVENNVEQLKNGNNVIDTLWAHFAASAVCTNKNERKVTRYLVPVVSKSLTDVIKSNIENTTNINEFNVHSLYRSICPTEACNDINDIEKCEIDKVVGDIVDYVVKREQFEKFTIPYDPDIPYPTTNIKIPVKKIRKSKVERELKRLINVTLVDEWLGMEESNSTKVSCGNEYCAKGCICKSLNSKLTVFHCGKLECMFEPICDCKINFNNSPHGRVVLAKEESSWHQTVIRKNNEVIEIKAEGGKSKRAKKLPTRYRTNVLLGKEMNCWDYTSTPCSSESSKKLSSSNKDKIIKNKQKDSKIKKKHEEKESKIKEKGVRTKDKESKIKDKEDRTKVKDSRSKEKGSKLKYKNDSRVSSTLKTSIKKDGSNAEAPITPDLIRFLNRSDFKKINKIPHKNQDHLWSLTDILVWCTNHYSYSCSCSDRTFIFKTNRLLRKSTFKKSLSSQKVSKVLIDSSMPTYHLYNQINNCARTIGSLFNYTLRNRTPVFKYKRLTELACNFLSNTNSFIKVSANSLEKPIKSVKSKQSSIKINQSDVTQQIYENKSSQIANNENISSPTKVKHNVNLLRKRKRSDTETKDTKLSDKLDPTNDIKKSKDDENGSKKRYRIGPAHYDWMGSYKTIVTNDSPQNNVTSNSNEDPICIVSASETISTVNINNTPKDNISKSKLLPKYGLLCLTQGFGYLPIKEFTQKKLQVQDPISENVFHCFKDIDSANKWLNRFFKNRIVFESLDINLKWVIVKPGILKHSQPFNKSLLENPSKVVDKHGFLVEKESSIFHLDIEEIKSESQEVNKVESKKYKENKMTQDLEEMPLKKLKITSSCSREETGILPIHTIKKKKEHSPKIIGDTQIISQNQITRTNFAKPSQNALPTSFGVNNKPGSSSEGCFSPSVSVQATNDIQLKNVNSVKHRGIRANMITDLGCNNSSATMKADANIRKKVNIGRSNKGVSKTVTRKSILKTKIK